jgi:hypothetical protein
MEEKESERPKNWLIYKKQHEFAGTVMSRQLGLL